MADDQFFDEGSNQEQGTEGGRLRAQLEEALQVNKQMKSKLTGYEVQAFLGSGQFDLVKPDDLSGVDPSKREETAKEIQADRQEQQRTLLKSALSKQGFDEETIEQMVNGEVAANPDQGAAEATQRIRDVGRFSAQPPPKVDMTRVTGIDAIRAAYTT